jgi:hypothetical protein
MLGCDGQYTAEADDSAIFRAEADRTGIDPGFTQFLAVQSRKRWVFNGTHSLVWSSIQPSG